MNTNSPLIGLMVVVCGCSGADGATPGENVMGEAPREQSGEPTGQVKEPIFQGIAGDGPAVVGLQFRQTPCVPATGNCMGNFCTGAIVSSHVILTAGHCVTRALWQQFSPNLFSGSVAVTYMDPRDRVFKCLTRTSGSTVGGCVNTDGDFRNMAGLVDPSFNGSPQTDARNDVAIIGNASLGWPGLDQTDAARIATGSTRNGVSGAAARVGDLFTAIGFGDDGMGNLGTLRFDTDGVRVDSVSGSVISNNASTVRMCLGDSGSPAMAYNSPGHPIVMGVHSNSSQTNFDFCTTPGKAQVWAQTDTEIGFINSGLALFNTPCTNVGYILATSLGMSVRECW